MSHHLPTPEGKDPELWRIAQRRASFKSHLMVYLIVNAFLWAVWFFNGGMERWDQGYMRPWPLFTTLGWGIGLAFHFLGAYVSPRFNSPEREYEKLERNRK